MAWLLLAAVWGAELLVSRASGQTTINGSRNITGDLRVQGATATVQSGTALPAACSPGPPPDLFLRVSDRTYHYCSAVDTWQMIGGTGSVSSVFSRTGAVAAASGDYTAAQVTNVPAGDVQATTVQAAIAEIDAEKVAADLLSAAGSVPKVAAARRITESGCTIDANNNLACPGSITAGAGSSGAGEVMIYEAAANGEEYWSWVAPNSLGNIVRLQFPNAVPMGGQVMALGAPGSDRVSAITLANKVTTPSGTGLVAHSGSDASVARRLTGTTNEVAVTNGDGLTGDPQVALADRVDLSGKTATLPVKAGLGSAAPSSCGANKELYIMTDSPAGRQLFICNGAGNGWNLVGDGGGGLPDPGDSGVLARTAVNTTVARAITGTSGAVLVNNGDGTAGNPTIDLDGNHKISTLGIVIDGGGSAISTGSKGYAHVPFACTLNQWTLLADQGGSAVIDVKRSTYNGFPTTSSIVGAGNKPTLSSAQKNQAAPSAWTSTAISADDVLEFSVDSASTVTRVTLALKCTR